jgi:hypothetical protein
MITVAIPAWNVDDIMWLPLESLCRQKTNISWELIILEEKHDRACGEEYFTPYLDRLGKVGCINFRYITRDEKMALSEKWAMLGREAHKDSVVFGICDGDNYYQEYMLQDAWDAIADGEHDWLTTKRGYWYNFEDGTFVEYNKPKSPTGLQMSIATRLMRNLPDEQVHRLLNRWVYTKAGVRKPKDDQNRINTLCTHGYGNISGDRRAKMMREYTPPFYRTDKTLEDIVPKDVAEKIRLWTRK